jgi:hypothetical protein
MAADWPLLTGGRYSEVVVKTGLTVSSSRVYSLIVIIWLMESVWA